MMEPNVTTKTGSIIKFKVSWLLLYPNAERVPTIRYSF